MICKSLFGVLLLAVSFPLLSFSESVYLMDEATKQQLLTELQKLKQSQLNQLESSKKQDHLIESQSKELTEAKKLQIKSDQRISEIEEKLIAVSKESIELRQLLNQFQSNKLFEIAIWTIIFSSLSFLLGSQVAHK